jgi:predicted CXXCH cytochrome family protein
MKTKIWTLLGLLAVSLIFLLGIAVIPVSANSGPHGGYTATTDACAGCHRAHTAAAAGLLVNSVPNLCFTCHGSTATGADTNVTDGLYEGTGGGNLLAGGFTNYQGVPVSSTHSVNGTWQKAWGSGIPWTGMYYNPGCAGCHTEEGYGIWGREFTLDPLILTFPSRGQNIMMDLTCTSCHDPHGGRNYRVLQQRLHPPTIQQEDPPGYVLVTSNEVGGQNPNLPGYVPNYVDPKYQLGLGDWCTGCHFTYHQTVSVSGAPFNAEDGKGLVTRYRHAMNATLGTLTTTLPLEDISGNGSSADDQLFCLSCHFAHGTSVSTTGLAANIAPTDDSALLRIDNRGVCEDCHQK